jgi:hypothetical protein
VPFPGRGQRFKAQLHHAAVAGRVLVRPLDAETVLAVSGWAGSTGFQVLGERC